MDNWKQPIPTNLDSVFGDNKLSKWIYVFLLLRARNSDQEKYYAGSLHFLKKGEAVCGMQELADEFNVNRKTASNALVKLKKVYNKVDIKTTSKGTVVSIKNYDEIVSMGQQNGQQSNNKVTTTGQQRDTNKNDKSVKSVKSERNKLHKNNFSKFESLTENVIREVCKHYKVAYIDGKEIAEDLRLYCQSNGKTYKNYKAALENWIRRRIKDNPNIIIKVLEENEIHKLPATNTGSEGIDRGNLEKIKELRKQFDSKRFESPF